MTLIVGAKILGIAIAVELDVFALSIEVVSRGLAAAAQPSPPARPSRDSSYPNTTRIIESRNRRASTQELDRGEVYLNLLKPRKHMPGLG
jgi:hypothetical protein